MTDPSPLTPQLLALLDGGPAVHFAVLPDGSVYELVQPERRTNRDDHQWDYEWDHQLDDEED